MLFIGVGFVSTVKPKYPTLVSIHKPLGIAILVLALVRLGVRLRYGAPSLPADLPEPVKIAAKLSHYAFYVLIIGIPLIGWGMLSAASYPVVLFAGTQLLAILPRATAYIRCCGMRTSALLSCCLPWSWFVSRPRCSMRLSDVTAYSRRRRPCRLTTRSCRPSDVRSGRRKKRSSPH
jgi:cytochrome b561